MGRRRRGGEEKGEREKNRIKREGRKVRGK